MIMYNVDVVNLKSGDDQDEKILDLVFFNYYCTSCAWGAAALRWLSIIQTVWRIVTINASLLQQARPRNRQKLWQLRFACR